MRPLDINNSMRTNIRGMPTHIQQYADTYIAVRGCIMRPVNTGKNLRNHSRFSRNSCVSAMHPGYLHETERERARGERERGRKPGVRVSEGGREGGSEGGSEGGRERRLLLSTQVAPPNETSRASLLLLSLSLVSLSFTFSLSLSLSLLSLSLSS